MRDTKQSSGYPCFTPLEELAGLVEDGDRLGVGGALFSRLPLALVQAVIRKGTKDLGYVSWSGGITLELLLAAGAVKRIDFCFSSLDLFGLSPLFRKALEEKSVEAEDWTAISLMVALRAAQARLPSGVFRPAPGSVVYERADFSRKVADPWSGEELAAARALPLDVCLMHAARADEDGNVEILGSQHLDESILGASKKTLFTVEEIVPCGALGHPKGSLIWPRKLVTAIALAPGGAYPSSSPGYYTTDYRALAQATTIVPVAIEPAEKERIARLRRAEGLDSAKFRAEGMRRSHGATPASEGPACVEEIMIHWLASQFDNDSICSVGAVSPLAQTAYLLAKKTHAPGLAILAVNAGCVDPRVRPMSLTFAESQDSKTAVHWCGGDHAWFRYYLPRKLTHEVVSSAQIDAFGRSNTIEIRAGAKVIRLPGQGGMAEVADIGQHLVFYLARHARRSLVEAVDIAAVGRTYLTDEERTAQGLPPGTVKLITDLCVFEVSHSTRRFELTHLHPGVTVEKVREETGFAFEVSRELCPTPFPSEEQLRILREEIDPLGIRFLESVASKERPALLASILDAEDALIDQWTEEGA